MAAEGFGIRFGRSIETSRINQQKSAWEQESNELAIQFGPGPGVQRDFGQPNGVVGNGASPSYLRQTIINCCQLLPERGIIRVSKEPLTVSKGHWKNQ